MASAEIISNLKLITSGNVPTTSNLGNGELAFGLVGGVAKLYGNVNGTIVDFSDFLRTAPVTSVAGKTGIVTLEKGDVGLGNVDNVKQYSASNPPPYPVTSVNGKTGAVVIDTGGTPYVTTITSWSGSSGNYYKQITAATHGKGKYPSVHTYVQNGRLLEETYVSPEIDASGNVMIYINVDISIRVVIK